jgi:hypothetical protein
MPESQGTSGDGNENGRGKPRPYDGRARLWRFGFIVGFFLFGFLGFV